MTTFIHTINQINQLQYDFSVFCKNVDSLCLDMSMILDYFHYLLIDPRMYYYHIHLQGGESKGNFFMEQAKMTPRKELCESKVSVMSFLPCY